MTVFRLLSVATGLGLMFAAPLQAAAPAQPAEQAAPARTKPDFGRRIPSPVRTAMRATVNADGTVTFQCSTVPHPKHPGHVDARPDAGREER